MSWFSQPDPEAEKQERARIERRLTRIRLLPDTLLIMAAIASQSGGYLLDDVIGDEIKRRVGEGVVEDCE